MQVFIGTDAYRAHKTKRFPRADNQTIAENQAFLLSDPATRTVYEKAYGETSALYYQDKPSFDQILEEIGKWIDEL